LSTPPFIKTLQLPGNYIQFCEVRHPKSGGFIDRREAFSKVTDVSPEVQARINTERQLCGLSAVEGLNDDDRAKYAATMARMDNITVEPCEIGADNLGNQIEDRRGIDLPQPPPHKRSAAHFEARGRAAAARHEAEQSSPGKDASP
jgi:hypothetical protein